ncbi:MAG: 4Fe-4S dicluster domain-containing protein [Deltaproteobacteria bacterium]|nr:4Fe-4S dicluster domain-containing protein [Deltaproteobacteria bacterium]MBW2308418.1 4Fe-4S dicluster domain-containing protein [Deltaproteobacteria bacterium]
MSVQSTRKTDLMVRIVFRGIQYEIPENLTVIQALEHAGHVLTRGCGCRGGVCGACVMAFRMPDDHRLHVGLACQTVAVNGMDIQQLLYFPATHRGADLSRLKPRLSDLLSIHPEVAKCLGCYTCTKSCPQDIQVGEAMAAVLREDWEVAYQISFECIMCGMCTSRCPAELSPHQILMVVRRLYGRDILPMPEYLNQRLEEIRNGVFNDELQELRTMDNEAIRERFQRYLEQSNVGPPKAPGKAGEEDIHRGERRDRGDDE